MAINKPTTISIVLSEQELWVVEQVSKLTGIGTTSATVRYIINDYAKRNLVGAPAEGNGGQATLVDVRAGYAVQSPKEPA